MPHYDEHRLLTLEDPTMPSDAHRMRPRYWVGVGAPLDPPTPQDESYGPTDDPRVNP